MECYSFCGTRGKLQEGQAIEVEYDLDSDSYDLTVNSDREDALDDFGFLGQSQHVLLDEMVKVVYLLESFRDAEK